MRALIWAMSAGLLLVSSVSPCQGPASLAGDIVFLDDPTEGDYVIAGDLALAAGDHVQLVLNHQDDGTCYLLDISAPQARFHKLSPDGSRPIGAGGELRMVAPGEARPFTVSRKNHRLRLICEGYVVCSGWDGSLATGRAGAIGPEGQVIDPYVQPLGAIAENDDFVRESDAQSMWAPIAGTWQTESLRDDDQAEEMEADKSANAFSYHGVSTEGPAISLASQDMWFWADYRISASARQMGAGAMGLVLLAQDEANYLAMRWASSWDKSDRGNKIGLIEVTDGATTVLAEKPGGFLPDQWYALSAAVCDGRIVCWVDDVPVLEAASARFGQGSAGLYAEGPEGAYFDDVVIADHEALHEDFADLSRWEAVEGEWSAESNEARCAGAGTLWSGRYEWRSYGVAATASAKSGPVGIQLARQPDGSCVLFRVTPGPGNVELVRVTADGEQFIAGAKAGVPKGKPIALAAAILPGGFVTGYIGDERVVDGLWPGIETGAIGLTSAGPKRAAFSDVRVGFIEARQAAQITTEFTDATVHHEMVGWAGRRAPWVEPDDPGRGATWWTKGDYYGDTSLSFKIRFVGLRDGSVTITLEGDPETPDEGLKLMFGATKGSKVLTATLVRDGEEVESAQVELEKSSCRVELSHRSPNLLLLIDGQPLIARDV